MKDFKNTLIQITHNGMGHGDNQLGIALITNYMKLLNEENELPRHITFYNEGVKLLCTESPALEAAQKLEKKGVKLIACKTCLGHFGLLNQLKSGIAGTMIDIIELQKIADKVINL